MTAQDKFNPAWTKAAIAGGLCLVAIGAAFDYGAAKWSQQKLNSAIAKCESDTPNFREPSSQEKANGWSKLRLVCDTETLTASNSSPPPGVQRDVVEAYHDVKYNRNEKGPFFYALASLTPIPWLWYWFLRRLREIKQALSDTNRS